MPASLLFIRPCMLLEGIVSKRRNSVYCSGECRDWVKIKTESWRAGHRERRSLNAASYKPCASVFVLIDRALMADRFDRLLPPFHEYQSCVVLFTS